ncbi:MAG: metalloregulator ArsR/SmtB family transcription factor [Clostridia bacterium]|nr:metalloregulator ArsR/SmtB family transcription factor [Clostridia bacterium]
MEHETLNLLKTVADETRIKILSALGEKDCYTELLAERLGLSAATVSFHMKKLVQAGLVDVRREQYYMVYSLRRDVFNRTLGELVLSGDCSAAAEALREEQYRRKVLKTFMPDGYCETMPAQLKKRVIVYREIFARFVPGRTYTEKEVNAIISEVHGDYCTVRRGFIGMGWMQRSNGIYTVNPNPEYDRIEDING